MIIIYREKEKYTDKWGKREREREVATQRTIEERELEGERERGCDILRGVINYRSR